MLNITVKYDQHTQLINQNGQVIATIITRKRPRNSGSECQLCIDTAPDIEIRRLDASRKIPIVPNGKEVNR